MLGFPESLLDDDVVQGTLGIFGLSNALQRKRGGKLLAVERNALIAIVVSLTGGCAALNSVSDSLFTDRSEKSREVQDIFYR